MKKIGITICIAGLIIGGIFMTLFIYQKYKFKDLKRYTEKLLNIEWGDCITKSWGDIKINGLFDGEYAHIKLEVRKGDDEKALGALQKKYKGEYDISTYALPGYRGHPYASEIKDSDIQFIYGPLSRFSTN